MNELLLLLYLFYFTLFLRGISLECLLEEMKSKIKRGIVVIGFVGVVFFGGVSFGVFFLYLEFSLVLQTCKPPRAVPWFGLAVVCRIPQESC